MYGIKKNTTRNLQLWFLIIGLALTSPIFQKQAHAEPWNGNETYFLKYLGNGLYELWYAGVSPYRRCALVGVGAPLVTGTYAQIMAYMGISTSAAGGIGIGLAVGAGVVIAIAAGAIIVTKCPAVANAIASEITGIDQDVIKESIDDKQYCSCERLLCVAIPWWLGGRYCRQLNPNAITLPMGQSCSNNNGQRFTQSTDDNGYEVYIEWTNCKPTDERP